MDLLQSKNLAYVFNDNDFNHCYRKFNGTQSNAFCIGIRAADMMIENYKPMPEDMNYYNEFFN